MSKTTPDGQPRPDPFHHSPCGDFVLYHGDCMEVMTSLPDGVARVIFADPPYFLSNGGITCKGGKMAPVNKGKWDESKGFLIDQEFTERWLSECRRLLHPDGTIWVSGTRHIIHVVGCLLAQLGFKLLNDITWVKPNPPPNLCCRYFKHATETVLWAARSHESRHTFNYALMKELNGGKQMDSVWKVSAPGRLEKREGRHPTQKPLALLDRIVLASSSEGDLVLDPFSGSGTTGLAAVRKKRRFIGIEKDRSYCELSRNRWSSQQGGAGE